MRIRRNILLAVAITAVSLGAAVGVARTAGIAPFTKAAITPPVPVMALGPLDVFNSPPTARERIVAAETQIADAVSVLTSDDVGVPDQWLPGQARAGDLRVPLSGLGPSQRDIFMFRTSKGILCYGLTNFSAGCLPGLPSSVPVTATTGEPDLYNGGEGAIVWGFARNNVVAIDVIAGGSTYPAQVGRNAYFFQFADNRIRATEVEAVVAHLKGGRAETVPVRPGPVRSDIPHSGS